MKVQITKTIVRLLAASAVLLGANFALAQATPPDIQWDKSFGGTGYDYLNSLQQTSDGGYIIGGYSDSGKSDTKTDDGFGSSDYWVVKLDANGVRQWDKSFGGSDYDVLQSLQQTSDGGYVLGGYSLSGASGNKTNNANFGASDYWVVKLDADGNRQWDQIYGGSGDDQLQSLQQTSDGGYILGGQPFSGASGNKTSESFGGLDHWVVKLAGVPLPPTLTITLVNKIVVALSWPTNATGFNLQSALHLTPPVDWIDSSDTPVPVGTQFTVTNTLSGSNQFYRLKKP